MSESTVASYARMRELSSIDNDCGLADFSSMFSSPRIEIVTFPATTD